MKCSFTIFLRFQHYDERFGKAAGRTGAAEQTGPETGRPDAGEKDRTAAPAEAEENAAPGKSP